jgi:ribosome assembly protein 4
MTGHSAAVNMVSFSPDGRFIVSASYDKSLKMWDGFNGDLIGNCRGHV